MSEEGIIGREGALPWRLPRDLKRFRKLTMGLPIIMGRKTFASIGRPLDGRLNVVMSRDQNYDVAGIAVAHSVEEALSSPGADLERTGRDEVMVIGGEEVFRAFAPKVGRVYLTTVSGRFEGDAKFPVEILGCGWVTTIAETYPAEGDAPAHEYRVLERPDPLAGRRASSRATGLTSD